MKNIEIVRRNINLEGTLETDFKIRGGIYKTTDSINPVIVCINLESTRWLDEVNYKYSPECFLFYTSSKEAKLVLNKYQGFSNIKIASSDLSRFDPSEFILFLNRNKIKYIDVLKICLPSISDEITNIIKSACSYRYLQVNNLCSSNNYSGGDKKVYELPGINSLWEKSMTNIHIRDNNFFSDQYPDRPNKYFNWVWDRTPVDSEITVFSDSYVKEAESSNSKIKVAWLIEPPVINSFIYQYVTNNHHLFQQIYTFDENLLKVSPKFKFFPYGTTWIHNPYKKVYDKNKLVSAIFSFKKFTEGHRIRHEIFNKYQDTVNFYGSINNKRIEHKVEGLQDYAFSVVVENWNGNDYFSEKLMDCLMTGAIPIYWGFKNYSKFFNPEGFLYFETMDQFDKIIKDISIDLYLEKIEAVKDNFKRAFDYIDLEEHLWTGGLKDLVNG